MSAFDLRVLGWAPPHDLHCESYQLAGCRPGRVAGRSHEIFDVITATGPRRARVSGRYRHQATIAADDPVVGDWVALHLPSPDGDGVIEGLLPRSSTISRKAAAANGKVAEQVLVANVETVFLVSSLNREFNPRRMERYLITAWESGADPVIVLNKADLCPDPQEYLDRLGPIAAGVPVLLTSAETGQGVEALTTCLGAGRTAVLLGSSGKSSLINRLSGREIQATGAIRADDDRGRHTTTRSDLLLLPGGGLLVDTPGLRELLFRKNVASGCFAWKGGSSQRRAFGSAPRRSHRHAPGPQASLRNACGVRCLPLYSRWPVRKSRRRGRVMATSKTRSSSSSLPSRRAR